MAKLLVLDTESGGLDPQVHSILSVGAVVWEDGKLGPEIEIFVLEDPLVVTPRALEVNRIDLVEHARKAVPPLEAQQLLHAFWHDNFDGKPAVMVAHNADHDAGFMRRLMRLANPDDRRAYDTYFSHRKLDTAGVLRFLHLTGKLPEHAISSDGWIKHFGIEIPGHERHTGLGDARGTAQLLTKLIDLGATAP